MRSIRILAIAVLMVLVKGLAASAQQPNVVFVLTDDQGYGDIAAHGNPYIKTPHLDELYHNSIRFTDYHVATTCAPSRSGLLSGKYCNEVGAWHTIMGRQMLAAEETTIAQLFKNAGYKTAIFGKWHLGDSYPFRPQDRGFDETLIHGGGGITQAPDYWNNDYFDDVYLHNGKPKKYEGYCNDIWFSEATKFILKNKKKPFFCYIPTNSPHGPYRIMDEYSNPYKGIEGIPNPNFYGMIANIDMQVGRLIDRLKKEGLYENTIFVFMTDNGTAAGVKFGKDNQVAKGFNAGMRGTKGSPYEGGHRVPFYLNYEKAGLSQGRDINQLTSYTDFLPTMLDLCKIPLPDDLGIDGRSLVPLTQATPVDWPERTLVVDVQREEHLVKYKQYSVMTTDWRLVNGTELYKIKEDPGQNKNLAAQYPERVQVLKNEYEKWWEINSKRAEEYSRVIIGSPQEKVTVLTSHDQHIEEGEGPAWNQMQVRAGVGGHGFWALKALKKGKYRIELRRYPRESKLKVRAVAPKGEEVPGGDAYLPGKALAIQKMKIKFGERTLEKELKDDQLGCVFDVNLEEGDLDLYSYMVDDVGKVYGAYYVYIEKK
ncbi:arylsulfatase A-like enzyme [Dyadobacter jejuensis]|uniref:Arylsulfatase A-like enzyme n=1 Tax=Dyadobacter jejuensis TaxID=1082580 RepID=A0A316AKY3_9BACT|nr:arylsulfatase [Dyadobacter jejuensis]PWJ58038.1 arylsulfatase A-like enzyme [Dyadobacter jejuensis]